MGAIICKNKQSANAPPLPEQNKRIGSDSSTGEQYVEQLLCKASDIQENEMKVFELEDDAGKLLLVKQNGVLSALGNKCTHYGAPLVNGVLGQGRIRCQWHGACFNIMTGSAGLHLIYGLELLGDIEDFPGLDSLPCYEVQVDANENVRVRAKRSELLSNKRVKAMCRREATDPGTIVVVGGGPSGACCVETLRQEGYSGRLVLVCKENCLPYDRVKVSKSLDFDIAKAEFRTAQFYESHDIEVLVGVEVTAVDAANSTVTLSDGRLLRYSYLYVATGSSARRLDIPGAHLPQVCVLRDHQHARLVHAELAPHKHVVVVGLSFIAMEAAAYCVNKVERVTVVGRDSVPFRALLGDAIGARLLRLFQEKGIHFELQSGLRRCVADGNGDGDGERLTAVELLDGRTLRADLCILGVGSTLNTALLVDSGVHVDSDGAVPVDGFLQTNVPNVFAGGDIARAPLATGAGADGEPLRATIGHYPLAHYHGRIAALNMLRHGSAPLNAVPFFWTQLFGKSIRYAGFTPDYDDLRIVGDLDECSFVAYYLKGDTVVAMASCQRDPIVSKFAELLAAGGRLTRSMLGAEPALWP